VLNASIYEFTNFVLSFLALVLLGIFANLIEFNWLIPFAFIPIFFLLLFLIGIGTILSILTVYFRDLMHIIPAGVQALFFLTPIIYTRDMIPAKYQFLVTLNPFYYFLEAFRSLLISGQWPTPIFFLIILITTLVSLILGLFVIVKYNNKIVFKL
jgi:ABC-type polysaccharide/polyol phosphate export permease